MRTLAKIAAVLLFSTPALAQRISFSTVASHSLTAHYRGQSNFSRTTEAASQRRWYWEDPTCSGNPAPSPMDRSAIFANTNDFSPVSISWTFSGKHPLVPTFEVAGFDVKPGAPPSNPDARYGSISSSRIWNRASHALMAALRY